MSQALRDVNVAIGMDISDGPLAQLNRRIDDVISALGGIDISSIDSAVDDVGDLSDEFGDLEDSINDATREVDNLDRTDLNNLDNEVKKADKGMGALKKGVLAVGSALLALGIGAALKDFTTGSIEAAASAQAMSAQFDSVFGELEKESTSSLENIAKETGMLPNRLKGSFTQMAAFAKTTGASTEEALSLTERATLAAADSAAFYDKSIEEVSETMQSFLKGNFENDAALGISATETTRNAKANDLYGKSFTKLSESQKQLTLLAMVEDGNKLAGALGQAAKESEAYENQMGNLKQSWQDFLAKAGAPILEQAVGVLSTLSDVISNIDPGPFMEFISSGISELGKLMPIADAVYNSIMSIFYDTGEVSDIWQNLGLPKSVSDNIASFGDVFRTVLDVIGTVKETIMSLYYDTGEISDLWQNLGIPPEIADSIADYAGQIKQGFEVGKSVVIEFVENVIIPLIPVAQEFIGNAMGFISKVVSGAMNYFEILKSVIGGLIEGVIVPLMPLAKNVIETVFNVISPILRIAGALFEGVSGAVKFLVTEIVVPLLPLVSATLIATWDFMKPVLDAIISAFNGIADAVEWVVDKIGGLGKVMKNLDIGGKISSFVSKTTDNLPGFEVGLGRVPFDEMPALLHKDEAILPADEADALRNAGILKGDGTDPTLDFDGASYNSAPAITSSTTNTNVQAPIQIIVQGSDNPQETARSIKEELEGWYSDLNMVFPVVMEG